MPFTWQIDVQKNPPGTPRVTFDPNPLNSVAVGDQIIWTNHDSEAHWPALKASDGTINDQYFMANPIVPNSPSSTFVVSETPPTTLNYVCFLHQDEAGAIIVG